MVNPGGTGSSSTDVISARLAPLPPRRSLSSIGGFGVLVVEGVDVGHRGLLVQPPVWMQHRVGVVEPTAAGRDEDRSARPGRSSPNRLRQHESNAGREALLGDGQPRDERSGLGRRRDGPATACTGVVGRARGRDSRATP